MTRVGLRFRPPGVSFDTTTRWLLARAFAEPETAPRSRPDPERLEAVAGSLDVGARIATRIPQPVLEAEAGRHAAVVLTVAATVAEAQAELVVGAVSVLGEIAADMGASVALLKYAALEVSGSVARGSRMVSDLDVLAAESQADDLVAALAERGYRSELSMPVEHHLPVQVGEDSVAVEIHTTVPGVRLGGRSSATLGELTELELVRPVGSLHPGLLVPSREVLVAHALAHGIAQHGLHPASYPMMRMVADLVDLGFAGDDGERLAASVRPWIARDVSDAEVEAARRLCVALVSGDNALFDATDDAAPQAVLLRHVVAGAQDPAYREALKMKGAFSMPGRGGRLAGWLFAVRQAVFITREQVDLIYGRPRSALGYLGWRLVRPFDLLRRAVASAWRSRMLHRRMPD